MVTIINIYSLNIKIFFVDTSPTKDRVPLKAHRQWGIRKLNALLKIQSQSLFQTLHEIGYQKNCLRSVCRYRYKLLQKVKQDFIVNPHNKDMVQSQVSEQKV